MDARVGRGVGLALVVTSFGVALVLSILPMPQWAEVFRPQWLAMLVLFWSMTEPDRVGVFWGFSSGLLLDVVSGTLLGQHALVMSLLAFLGVELHQRIRPFPPLQQAFSIWVLLLLERLLSLWILGATGQPTPNLWYWTPTFVGMALWPWLFALMSDLRRRSRTG